MARVAAAASASFASDSAFGLLGFTSKAIDVAPGISSRNSPSRLAISEDDNMVTPVTLPPGRRRLATKPDSTGSLPLVKTIGIVEVAAFAARAAGGACAK